MIAWRSVRTRPATKAWARPIDKDVTAAIERSPTVTARASGRRRLPSQPSQGRMVMYASVSSLNLSEVDSA
ncbi:hypothetical protein D3C86_1389210 [compost metagenome]